MAAPSTIVEVSEAHADYARAARRNRIFGLGNGRSIVAYSRAVPELGGSLRVFTRLLVVPHDRAVRH